MNKESINGAQKVEVLHHEFSPNDEDKRLLRYHRQIRLELCDKIAKEIYKSAFILDGSKGEHYRSYVKELIVSCISMIFIQASEEIDFDLSNFSSLLTTSIVKILKFLNSASNISLREAKFIEQFCDNMINSKDMLYNLISEEPTLEDFQ